jgi:hypothetical protein
MPETFVVHVSPARTDIASVKVPVEIISPACSAGLLQILRQQFDQMAEGEQRAIKHETAAAHLAQFSVATQFNLESCEFALPFGLTRRHCMPRPNQKRSMDAIRSDRIGGREFPAGKNRLHNFIAKSQPFDAIEQRGFVHAGQRHPFQAEYDFWLDARFDKILYPQNLCSAS